MSISGSLQCIPLAQVFRERQTETKMNESHIEIQTHRATGEREKTK